MSESMETIAVIILFIFVIAGIPALCSKYVDKRDLCYINCNM